MNLEANYRLQIATTKSGDGQIAQRSELYGLLPVRELVRRGWVTDDNILEEVESLLGVSSLAEWPAVAASLRLSPGKRPNDLAIIAWAKRVEHLVSGQQVGHFSWQTILASARSMGRHPGLVLGRLQHDKLVPFRNLRQLLPKVSPYLNGSIDRTIT